MLFLLWLVLSGVVLFLILLPAAIWFRETYRRYSGWRPVTCPENQQPAAVGLDASHAAATGMHGLPDVRLCACTRWPERLQCDRACLAQAVRAPADTGEVAVGTKAIHHLPIVLAAFAAWCMGAIWHSQYLFRPQLTDAMGLTHAQVKAMVWWNSPHVLTLAVCLLFAYGVGWLVAVAHRRGVVQGMLMSVLLCGAVMAASAYGIAELPRAVLAVEAGYIVLATLTVGAIVGGLQDRLTLRPH